MGRRGKGLFGGLGRGGRKVELGIGFDFESFSLESYLGI